MKLKFNIPIRAKLVIIVLAFATLPMLVLTLVWYNTAIGRMSAAMRQSLNSRAREIGSQLQLRKDKNLQDPATIEAAVGPRTTALTARYSPATVVRSDREVLVVDAAGKIVYAANPNWEHKTVQEALPAEIAQIIGTIGTRPISEVNRQRDSDQDRYFILGEPWLVLRRDEAGLSIYVIQRDAWRTQMDAAAIIVLLISFLLAVVATLLVYLIISGITESIRRVTRGAKAIAAGKLDTNIQVESNDETRVLAEAFNRMSDRLRGMIARESEQKQFESFARLSAVLTHDLKNAILSLSFLVTNMERKFDREGFKEDAMRTLSDSVGNLKNLVSKLSDPRSSSTDERKFEELGPIVERVLSRTADRLAERYQVSTEIGTGITATVNANALERVIENLVINALEAMPEGGKLEVALVREGDKAIISVADSGSGMSEDYVRNHLFQAFATTKRKGVGLGLFACKEIIEQHKGKIEVNSREGEGSTFRIVLPFQSAPSSVTVE